VGVRRENDGSTNQTCVSMSWRDMAKGEKTVAQKRKVEEAVDPASVNAPPHSMSTARHGCAHMRMNGRQPIRTVLLVARQLHPNRLMVQPNIDDMHGKHRGVLHGSGCSCIAYSDALLLAGEWVRDGILRASLHPRWPRFGWGKKIRLPGMLSLLSAVVLQQHGRRSILWFRRRCKCQGAWSDK
jgi:hypothetical protein